MPRDLNRLQRPVTGSAGARRQNALRLNGAARASLTHARSAFSVPRRSRVRARTRLREELLADERREHGVAERRIEIPETARLISSQRQPRRLDELHPDALEKLAGWDGRGRRRWLQHDRTAPRTSLSARDVIAWCRKGIGVVNLWPGWSRVQGPRVEGITTYTSVAPSSRGRQRRGVSMTDVVHSHASVRLRRVCRVRSEDESRAHARRRIAGTVVPGPRARGRGTAEPAGKSHRIPTTGPSRRSSRQRTDREGGKVEPA